MMDTPIANLTVGELRDLIHEVVTQVLQELLSDTDQGLILREAVEERLKESLEHTQAGVNTKSAQDVAGELGVGW